MRFPLLKIVILLSATAGLSCANAEGIDNSTLLPELRPDRDVRMEGASPDWVKSLVVAEMRIETATPEGTFASATRALDHFAETGVNGLWICPVWERGSKMNGYGNNGPATLEPLLTGAAYFEASLAVVRKFVEEAHRRRIRVLFDIVVWGTRKDAPLVTARPEFYKRLPDGSRWEVWGGYGFDWENAALRKWFQEAAVRFLMETGADGYRVDLAPDTSGYFFKEVRQEMYAKGRKIVLMSEMPNTRREVFDFEQNGVTGWTEEPDYAHPANHAEQIKRFGNHNEAPLRSNFVEMIQKGIGMRSATFQQSGRGGAFRYYTQNLLNHDDGEPFVRGSRVRFGYTAVFAPVIPLWWIGEEWNNPKRLIPDAEGGVMFFNAVDWAAREAPENRAFFEDVKAYIRIRRSYPEIFEVFPDDARRANILALESKRGGAPNPLQAYARYGGGRAVLIVPNPAEGGGKEQAAFETRAPLEKLGVKTETGKVKVTDLLTGKATEESAAGGELTLRMEIPADHLAVLLVEPR